MQICKFIAVPSVFFFFCGNRIIVGSYLSIVVVTPQELALTVLRKVMNSGGQHE